MAKRRIHNAVIKTLNTGALETLASSVTLGSGETVDLQGQADAMVLDADADTTISSPTDDQIDIEVGGSDVATITSTGWNGNTVGQHRHSTQALTATGAITINSGTVLLNHATVIIAATLDAPTLGDELYIINSSASGTAAHTVTLAAGVTFDGTNNTATLDAPDEALHILAISATRWYVLENIGTVGLSDV